MSKYSHKTKSRIGFIVQSYSEWAWWYEMWELFRKLMLVGVIALMRPGTVMQILWGLGICVGSSFVSLLIRPYQQKDDGWLNNLCLAQLQFVLFCGLLIRLDVDLFGKEGKGDSSYDAQFWIGLAVVASHISVMIVALCLLSYELANAPRHQAAVRASLQRKREAARRNLELWAKGRRLALMRKAKRDKEGSGTEGALKGKVMELETEQLSREAELRDEYDDLQKEIQSLGLINEEDKGEDGVTNMDGPAHGDEQVHHFLLDEKTRMERKKAQLELQMKSIIDENKANVDALAVVMKAKAAKARQRLDRRLAKRKKKVNALDTVQNVARGKSKFKRLIGVGHNGEHMNKTSVIPIGNNNNGSTVMHLQGLTAGLQLEEALLENKNETIFTLLGYYQKGDESIDNSIQAYVKEHEKNIDLPRDSSGSTLLIAAVRVNNEACVRLLLTKNASVNSINNEKACSLHYAAFVGNEQIVGALMRSGGSEAKECLQLQDVRGNTPAAYALRSGHESLAKKLGLESLNVKINLGETKSNNSSALAKWRRAAWRKGISQSMEKKLNQVTWKQTIALAKARKAMEEELSDGGTSSAAKKDLESKILFLTTQLNAATKVMEGDGTKEEMYQLKVELEEIRLKDKELSLSLEKEAIKRKQLHNQIEDMKGAIRVFCRFRPLNGSELAKNVIDVTEFLPNKTSLNLHPNGISKGSRKTCLNYSFDSCFSSIDTQEDIFKDVVHLIQSSVDGYNVCIFAYGQTGSGKTYTMNGTKQSPGIQPRSITEMYNIIQRDSDQYDFTVSTYMIEMYMNNLYDLLKHVSSGKRIGELNKNGTLSIDTNKTNGQVIVNGVTHCISKTSNELKSILESGMRKRQSASTAMNANSSRSHIITTIIIKSTDRKTKLTTTGKLTLVDLAGNENQKNAKATGDQLKEQKAINSSLSALGGVINALQLSNANVPYKNSKLTELLQDGLGGHAKCLMFVNANPAKYNIMETKSSFEFALKCKSIQNNTKSGKSVESEEVRDLKMKLKTLEAKVGNQSSADLN